MKNYFRSLFLCGLLFLIAPGCRAAIAPIEQSTLPNGSTLLVRRDAVAPRVAISLVVRAGATDETAATAGWRQVLAFAVLRATRLNGEDNESIVRLSDWQARLEKWGGQIGATVDDDGIEFWIVGDSSHTTELMRVLLQIVTQPRLAEEDLAAARRRALTLQNRAANTVSARATQSIARQLYQDKSGQPTAYALPSFGTFETLGNLTETQLRQWQAQFFVPARFIIAATGNADADILKAEINRLSAPAAGSTPDVDSSNAAPAFAPLASGQPPLIVREMDTGAAWVFVSYRTPAPGAMTPLENAAIEVLSAALEGSSKARLPQRLLGDESTPFNPGAKSNALAAVSAAQWTPRRFAGELTVFAQTGPQNVDAVKNALLDEMRKLRETPLSAAELQSAKEFARGSWAQTRSAPHERAFQAALANLQQTVTDTKVPDYLQVVTADILQKTAQKYLRDYAVVLIMPEE
jgi:predicted Zn-dependent peptidase